MGDEKTKVVEMKNISISFGGIKAVNHVSIDLYQGEVLGLVGHNGAGKTVLIKILSGALQRDEGEILVNGTKAKIDKPSDARRYGIETIYQTLALADNVDTAANLYLGRELLTRWGTVNDLNMEAKAREVMGRLNPRFERFHEPVRALSGGQRQSVAIARAILFDARNLIMDEPTAALGPQEASQVADLIKQLTAEGISIILISHDMHDVFDLVDRVVVLKNGEIVGTAAIDDVTSEEVLAMIILGKCAPKAIPGLGASSDAEYRPGHIAAVEDKDSTLSSLKTSKLKQITQPEHPEEILMDNRKQLSESSTIKNTGTGLPVKNSFIAKATADASHSAENKHTLKTRDSVSRNWHNLDNRLSMIAESAYFKAEKRGFEVGHEESDWLEAEQELARIMGET